MNELKMENQWTWKWRRRIEAAFCAPTQQRTSPSNARTRALCMHLVANFVHTRALAHLVLKEVKVEVPVEAIVEALLRGLPRHTECHRDDGAGFDLFGVFCKGVQNGCWMLPVLPVFSTRAPHTIPEVRLTSITRLPLYEMEKSLWVYMNPAWIFSPCVAQCNERDERESHECTTRVRHLGLVGIIRFHVLAHHTPNREFVHVHLVPVRKKERKGRWFSCGLLQEQIAPMTSYQ